MLDPVFTAPRPGQPGLIDRLRSDATLLDRVLDHHTSKPIRVFVPGGDQGEPATAEIPSACFWIRSVVRGSDNGAGLRAALSRSPAAVCGKRLRHGDVAFRCVTCSADNTCVFCRECFQASPCRNHEYRQLSSGGGACDCGDPEAWKPEGFCRHHSGASEETILKNVPPGVRAWLEICLRHALRLFGSIALCLRAAPKQLCESNDKSNGRLLCMAAGSLVKELVEVAAMSDDGRRLVALAMASTVHPAMEMLLAPVGEETSADFAAQRRNKSKATRQRGDVDDEDDDDYVDFDEDEEGAAGGMMMMEGDDEEEGEGDEDGEQVSPEELAAAEGDEELQGQLLMRLLNQMRRQQARQAAEAQRRESRDRAAREHQEEEHQHREGSGDSSTSSSQTPAATAAAAAANRQHVDPSDSSDILLQLQRSSSPNGSPATAAAASTATSSSRASNQAVSTLEHMSFVEMFLAMELCPFVSRPTFAAQCWSTLKALFDACACDITFRKAYTRGITRLALPWASAYCRSGGLFSVAVQCLTVATVVEEQLLPQQNIADNSTLISSLVAASILNCTQNAVTVEEANKRGETPTSRGGRNNNNNNNSNNSAVGEKIFQLPKNFPRQAFAHISFESYHPLMCSQPARVAALLSRPLFRSYLALLSLLHYNYFWRNELAAPMPRTSYDIELTNSRRLFQYAKAAGEVTRGLLSPASGTLEAALGMPHNKELADAIFEDCALHPVCTRMEHRNTAFHSLVQMCSSVAEPFGRLPMHSAAPEECVAIMLQRLLTDAVFFIARQERAIARSDARSRSQGGVSWMATITTPTLSQQDNDDEGDIGGPTAEDQRTSTTVSLRVLQRPYEILRDKHLIGFHFPLYRLVAAITMSTLRGVAASSSSSSSEYILRTAFSGAFSRVVSSEGNYSDALHNALDRIVACHVLGAQQLDSLWKRDFAGFTPNLQFYQSIDPTYFNELDNFFLQCCAGGIGTKVLSRLVLERFSYTAQDDRIDEKAVPLGYSHALRLLLTVATDPTRTATSYRGEVTTRLLTRLAVQGAEVRSRLQSQCSSTEADDEESKSAEDIFHEVLDAHTSSSRRRDANVFSLTDAAWSSVPLYTAGMPGSFPALARQQYHDRVGSKKSGGGADAEKKPVARSGIDRHGPAFRESLPVLLHETEVCSTSLFLLLCRTLSGTADTTSAAAQSHPLSSVLRFGRAWRGRKALAVTPSGVCAAIDALYLATETVFDLFGGKSQQQQQQQVIDWPKFEEWLHTQRSKQWQLAPMPTDSYTSNLPKTDYTPLHVAGDLSVAPMSESVFSFLLRRVTGVNLTAFAYYSNAKEFKSEVSFAGSNSSGNNNTAPVFTGVDVLEALLSNSEEALSDVANNSDSVPQLRKVVATVRDYEAYLRDPQARMEQLAAIAAGGAAAPGADGAAAAASSSSAGASAAGGKKVKTAKERASAALAAMKKKKMAAASNFLPEDTDGAAKPAAASDKKSNGDDDPASPSSTMGAGAVSGDGSMQLRSSTGSLFSRTTTEDNDTALLRSVLGGDALHRYAAAFVDESVCAFCHRKGAAATPLCHLAQLSRGTTESRVCQALSAAAAAAGNNSNNTAAAAAGSLACDGASAGNASAAQLNFCGHFAHEKCFTDRVTFTRAGMRTTSVFRAVRGHQYLQDGECLCAVCARIVSVAVPVVAPASTTGSSEEQRKQRASDFAAELLKVDSAQRAATGGAAAQAADPSSAVDLLCSVVCPTVVATVLDLQLGKRSMMLRETSGMCSLVALLRDALLPDSSATSSSSSSNEELHLPPLSGLVLQVLRQSFDACRAGASSSSASDDPLTLMPLVFSSISELPASVFSTSTTGAAAAASSSSSSSSSSSIASQLESSPLGVASFWVRLLLVTVQLGTGRLSDSQLGSIAESVLRCASTASSTQDPAELLRVLVETAADTISFPLWSPRVVAPTAAVNNSNAAAESSSDVFPTANAATTLGVLDVAEESVNTASAARFLFPTSLQSSSTGWLAAEQQQQAQEEQCDAIISAVVAAYPLPGFFRELLPVMRMAKSKKKSKNKNDDDDEKKHDRVNEPRPNSDEEPDDEEEAQRLAERRAMESNNSNNTTEDSAADKKKDDDDDDDDYDETAAAAAITSLVEASSSYVCSSCGTVPRIPVLCIFCRQVFCARATPPELTEHSLRCGGNGCGVFVQMKVTQPLVIQAGRRGQVQPSMFLDRFGEEDIGLRRGRPLMLNGERYRKFLRLCVRSSFDHATSELEDGGTFKNVSSL